jgi:hemolysin III
MARPLPQIFRRPLPAGFEVRIFKDPASAWTHFLGFLAALVATGALVSRAGNDRPRVAAMIVYGATLVGLFLASSLYHFFDVGERGNRWLRRLDHAAIFLLIGGTSVPILLHLLAGPARIATVTLVALLAVGGCLLKLSWIDCPDKLGVGLYFAMSLLVVLPTLPVLSRLPDGGLALLVVGGAAYTLGAYVYARRWPDPWPGRFGHHEVWHLFVLAGAGFHCAFHFTLLGFPPYAPV